MLRNCRTFRDVRSSALKRKTTFRLLSVLVALAPFVLLEIGLRVCGVGSVDDPLSGFNQNIPLFERDGGTYHTAKAREPFFPHQEFAAAKPTNSFRVFCFGGSTVHGHPYESETAFPQWLELELHTCDPNRRRFEAINCGGVSYASYRLAPLVKEVASYQPDLIVVATGENEFLEDRTYQPFKARSWIRKWVEDGLHSLRIVAVTRRWITSRRSKTADLPQQSGPSNTEIQTRLDSSAGYASYHRDGVWHDRVAAQYEESLREMVSTCEHAKVRLIFIKLGSNLRDCPPYKSEHRAGLPAEDERAWQELFDAAARLESDQPEQALANYRKAEKIDGQYALLLFRIGRLLDERGEKRAALDYYARARDEDICPLRLTSRHEEILTRVSQTTHTPLLDAGAAIADQSLDRIPGNDWYLDHVHPNIGGHQLIARALAARVREMRIVSGSRQWPEAERQAAFTAYMNTLGPDYLAAGLHRVQWLEHWARRERLFDEAQPHDAAACMRAAFRHLELAQDQDAKAELAQALTRDKALAAEAERHAARLEAEGRPNTAALLRSWIEPKIL
jgi:hypothetical protein